MNRRSFITDSTYSALGVITAPTLAFSNFITRNGLLFKLSLGPWSLMRTPYGQPDPDGINLFDYPMISKELGFDFVEQDNLHFPGELPDDKDIIKMRARCDAAGIKSSVMLCGALGDAADENNKKRLAAIKIYKRWIAAAAHLGCQSVRIVCADHVTILDEEKLKYAVDGVSRLVNYAAKKDMNLLIENHNGYSSDPDWLVKMIREVNHPRCGILADFTGWRINDDPLNLYPDPYKGIEILSPLTKSVGAKSSQFDIHGNETNINYYRMMDIIVKAGFRETVAVEYFGENLPRKEGIRLTKSLLEKVRDKLSERIKR